MQRSCLGAIREHGGTLTAAERRIAEYITNHREAVVNMPIAELAEEVGTAKSAVIRLSKSLGFAGYPELKLALAADNSKNRQLNYAPYIDPADDACGILDKIFAANVKTLHDTAEKLDRAVYTEVVELLHRSKNIYIFGIGTSASFVGELAYRLMQFGYDSHAFTDAPSMKIATLNMTSEDTAIGISHSGRTVATIEALSLARERGARTVCLTGYPGSRITEVSDYPLAVTSDEINYPVEAISARIAHLSLIDAITISLSAKNYERTLEREKAIREVVDTVRYK